MNSILLCKSLTIFCICVAVIIVIDTLTSQIYFDRIYPAVLCPDDFGMVYSEDECSFIRTYLSYWFMFAPPLFGAFMFWLGWRYKPSKVQSQSTSGNKYNDYRKDTEKTSDRNE